MPTDTAEHCLLVIEFNLIACPTFGFKNVAEHRKVLQLLVFQIPARHRAIHGRKVGKSDDTYPFLNQVRNSF